MVDGIVFNHFFRFLFNVSLILILLSCAGTGLKEDPLTSSERSKINKIGIDVRTEGDFDVKVFQAMEMPNFAEGVSMPYVYGGEGFVEGIFLAVDLAIAYSHYHSDESIENDLRPLLLNYNPEKIMVDRIIHYIDKTQIFAIAKVSNTVDLKSLKSEGVNSVLDIVIGKWGLFLCLDPLYWKKWRESCKYESLESMSTAQEVCPPIDHVSAMFEINGKINFVKDESILWEKRRFYIDSKCESIDKLRNKQGLIVEFLNSAINRFSENLVGEFVDSKTN